MSTHIPDPVIKRLPSYHRYILELEREQQVFISSGQLAARMGLTASQVRQDVNAFGGEGLQGCGYPVKEMRRHIEQLLGIDRPQTMIIIGAGNLGCAIARYRIFAQKRFAVAAAFDTNDHCIGQRVDELEIYSMQQLESYVQKNAVDIAVITTPASAAQQVSEELYRLGVRGFWNFAPLDLQLPRDASVVNVHLDESLELLSYRMHHPDIW